MGRQTTFTTDDVLAMLREACDAAGGIRPWARLHDLSFQYVHLVLQGDRPPGPAILNPLGLVAERVRIYRWKAKP